MGDIAMVGFDADDTLWRSQDYFDEAQLEFEGILTGYLDLDDMQVRQRLHEVEGGNIGVFGYGVKGMTLSMIEAAVELTGSRISAADIGKVVALGKRLLQHPVELLPGVREAVEAVGRHYPLVLITKGDLFHQEAKVRQCGLAGLFRRIEVVSEKDPGTYARLLEEFGLPARQFAMVGNSVRSDILPVLDLGGWAVHVPYHSTWIHEQATTPDAGHQRLCTVANAAEVPGALEALAARAYAPPG
ncbi:HAD family hydrolase [Lysobacter sp. GX 14042]|uniref:HAD family hydrolase n=1 Tax=Lysobacter sp. GX 14042 TaxID=2907155 RepID=UPI001F166A99|nr:HAD family hydrolase [Lysobacter sp. GX 14042]MCE7032021.1 HAD family hydrolase [Lysobacter sp. GX 14042]